MVDRSPVPASVPFPFDSGFQRSLLRLMMEDGGFTSLVLPHLNSQFFEGEALGWMFQYGQWHHAEYECWPSENVFKHQARQLDPQIQLLYGAAVEQVCQASLQDEAWMRAATIDFVKRNLFVRTFHESRSLYNAGKVDDAYDLMMERMDTIARTTWDPVDECDFFETFSARQNQRMNFDPSQGSVSTGIPGLDVVLSGGLSLGELGIVIAYSKCGKSTYLVNFGVAATKLNWRRTAHFVFESRRERVEDRYDASFMEELYSGVKRGELSTSTKYNETYEVYQSLRGLLKIRGFTERWDYSVVDIHNDLKRWKRESGWEPELIVIDYGDLIMGREKSYPNEREKQKSAFRDMKSLSNRGYAVWTASQAQRPDAGAEDRVHTLRSRQIADCYEKVRVADFLCTQNITREERASNRSRLYAELYRENSAEVEIPMLCDFSRMMLRQDGATLGYAQQQQQLEAQVASAHPPMGPQL